MAFDGDLASLSVKGTRYPYQALGGRTYGDMGHICIDDDLRSFKETDISECHKSASAGMDLKGRTVVHKDAVGSDPVIIFIFERIGLEIKVYLHLCVGIDRIVSSLYGEAVSYKVHRGLVRVVCDSEMAVQTHSAGISARIEVIVLEHAVSLEMQIVFKGLRIVGSEEDVESRAEGLIPHHVFIRYIHIVKIDVYLVVVICDGTFSHLYLFEIQLASRFHSIVSDIQDLLLLIWIVDYKRDIVGIELVSVLVCDGAAVPYGDIPLLCRRHYEGIGISCLAVEHEYVHSVAHRPLI